MSRDRRHALLNILATLALVCVGSLLVWDSSSSETVHETHGRILRIGWSPNYPYDYQAGDADARRVSGVDCELVREAFYRAGYQVEFLPRDWVTSLTEVESGQLDALSLAFATPQRERFALFSEPLFAMRSAIFYRRDLFPDPPDSYPELLAFAQRDKTVIGYTDGYAYTAELARLLAAPTVAERARPAKDDAASLSALMDGKVELAVADQLGGTSMVIRNGWSRQVGCLVLEQTSQNACVMFSKKNVSADVVQDFNRALAEMTEDGSRARLVRAYYYPSMLSMLAEGFGFDEIAALAVTAAAVSGIFLARKLGTNLVGAFVLAAAPAAGGGLLRDLVAGRRPVAVVANPSILLLVLLLVLLAFLVFRLLETSAPHASRALDAIDVDRHPALVFFDGLGLAAFTVIGVLVAMQWHCEPLWLWGPILAALTNGGGSALRDVILQRPLGLVFSRNPYVEVSIVWGWLLSCYLIHNSSGLPYTVLNLQIAIAATMLGVGGTYMATRLSGARSPTYGRTRPEPEPTVMGTAFHVEQE